MDEKCSLPNCAKCGEFLFSSYPKQCPCGDRLCSPCFSDLSHRNPFPCPQCEKAVDVEECFTDKAVVFEFRKAQVYCSNLGCNWQGIGDKYEEHRDHCAFATVSCYYEKYGCTEKLIRFNIDTHEEKCRFIPQQCFLCNSTIKDEKVHLREECGLVSQNCTNECGQKIARKNINHHLKEECALRPRKCEFNSVGCGFMGCDGDLKEHHRQNIQQHLIMVQQSKSQQITDMKAEIHEIRTKILAPLFLIFHVAIFAYSFLWSPN